MIKNGQKYALVEDSRGIKLSPTKEEKAWYMIRHGKARLVGMYPTRIQLLREQDNTDDSEYRVGIDPGDTTGIAVVNVCEKNIKVVFKADILHRKDVKDLLETRREQRRFRRSNKRYRKVRFLNRAASIRDGRVAPSIKNKKDEILRVVRFLNKYISVTSIYVEDVSFDVRALTEGYRPYSWQYQMSNRLDENIRKAVLVRDDFACQWCGKTNTRLEVHHITPRRDGGSNILDNLVTLCEQCHHLVTGMEEFYAPVLYEIVGGKQVSLTPAMHVMQGKNYLYKELSKIAEVHKTIGGDTSNKRIDLGVEKTHSNDAVCITGVEYKPVNLDTYVYNVKPLRKKIKSTQDTSDLEIKHRDLVWYTPRGSKPIKCYVTAIFRNVRHFGEYKLTSLDGKVYGPVGIKSIRKASQNVSGLLIA